MVVEASRSFILIDWPWLVEEAAVDIKVEEDEGTRVVEVEGVGMEGEEEGGEASRGSRGIVGTAPGADDKWPCTQ